MLSRTTSVASERWSRLLRNAAPSAVFAGEGWRGQPCFRAYDKRTGEIVAELEIPAQATSLLMTYMRDRKHYIVFAAGDGRTGHAAELIALTLPDSQ